MTQLQTESDNDAHLVVRPHLWRRQLSLRGCTMTVGQLVTTMRANQLSPQDAARIEEAHRFGSDSVRHALSRLIVCRGGAATVQDRPRLALESLDGVGA